MGHNHIHTHEHSHAVNVENLNSAFILGIILNSVFVVTEFLVGFIYNSAGLISDAGHNLSDVASLIIAMLAFRLAKIHPNKSYTYGYKKSTIHVSLINAIILIVAVCFIIYESVEKIINPVVISGKAIGITAGIGVIVNGLTAYLFLKDKDKDLNVKGAYLHMAADALVSVGVVISGIIINISGWYIIDSIIGLGISVIIIISTIDLLKDSVRLALDGVPKGIDSNEIVEHIKHIDNVEDVHHIHIWAISTTQNALTAHIKLKDLNYLEQTKKTIKEELVEHNISHSTLEFEKEMCNCNDCCE